MTEKNDGTRGLAHHMLFLCPESPEKRLGWAEAFLAFGRKGSLPIVWSNFQNEDSSLVVVLSLPDDRRLAVRLTNAGGQIFDMSTSREIQAQGRLLKTVCAEGNVVRKLALTFSGGKSLVVEDLRGTKGLIFSVPSWAL